MLGVLRWLPARQRIWYKVASLVWRCQLDIAPIYLIDLCRHVSGIARCALREGGLLVSHMQVRAFCVNAPSVWNGLPLMLRLQEAASYLGRFPTHSIVVLKLFF